MAKYRLCRGEAGSITDKAGRFDKLLVEAIQRARVYGVRYAIRREDSDSAVVCIIDAGSGRVTDCCASALEGRHLRDIAKRAGVRHRV